MDVKTFRTAVDRLQGQKDLLEQQILASKQRQWKLRREEADCRKARTLVQVVAQRTQKQLQFRLSELAKLALAAVFDNPYDFLIEFEQRRGRTEADFWFLRKGEKIDPSGNAGLGAVDIVGIALRLSLWSLRRPRSRPTIFIDEGMKHLKGEEANRRALQILHEVCKPNPKRHWPGAQVVLISDERMSREDIETFSDSLFEVKKSGTKSLVEKVR